MNAVPVRLQLKRTKGFKLVSPNGLLNKRVCRPSPWGNEYHVMHVGDMWAVVLMVNYALVPFGWFAFKGEAYARAVELYVERQLPELLKMHDIRKELGGCNLCCWCALDLPCHADILLKRANENLHGFRAARGVLPWKEGDELPEQVIRRLRDANEAPLDGAVLPRIET